MYGGYVARAGAASHLVELALQVERDGADRGGVRQRRVLAVVHHAADRPEHLVALAELDAPLHRRRVWQLQSESSVLRQLPHKRTLTHAYMATG